MHTVSMSVCTVIRAARQRVVHPRMLRIATVFTGVAGTSLALASSAACDGSPVKPPDVGVGAESQLSLWASVLQQLGLRRSDEPMETPLPTAHLQCHALQDRFGRLSHAGAHRPVVLVSCGSFNPPTCMHLRMFEVAAAHLAKLGYDVLGGYLSPVHSQYGKAGLAETHHRVNMAHLAAASCPSVEVDEWESSQPGYVRTLHVLQRVSSCLKKYFAEDDDSATGKTSDPASPATTVGGTFAESQHHIQHDSVRDAIAEMAAPRLRSPYTDRLEGGPPQPQRAASTQGGGRGAVLHHRQDGDARVEEPLRVMLLCGADLVASMLQPGVWKEEQLRQLLREHGLVVVGREGVLLRQLVTQPNTILYEHRHNIIVVDEPVANNISSTLVRKLLAKGEPVRYLVPEPVLQYIEANGLYKDR